MTAPMTPVAQCAGWIIKCHRRTGCDNVVWLPKKLARVLVAPRLVSEMAGDLPSGWVATYWDTYHTRMLRRDEECVAARPHYFCSEACQEVGCSPNTEPPCAAWDSSPEISVEAATEITRAAVLRERVEVDALLAERLKECFCTDQDSPCEGCFETSRIRGMLAGRPAP